MREVLRMSVVPEWEKVAAVRDETLAFLQLHGFGGDVANAIGMVAGELSENAAKYGTFDDAGNDIQIRVTLNTVTVTVEVSNPLNPLEVDNLARLDRMVQWIRGFQDPFEAYLERLKEVSAQSFDHNESGLGLVRIAYEGQSILDFFINEQKVLAVSATYNVNRQGGRS